MTLKRILLLLGFVCIARSVDSGYTYSFYDQTKTFNSAESYCQQLGGNLASPQDTDERLSFETALQISELNGNTLWLGGQVVNDGDGNLGLLNMDKGTRIWRWISAAGNDFLLGQGCYKDEGWTSDVGSRLSLRDVTVPTCLAECVSMGRMYAAIKRGEDCYCTDRYGSQGPIASNTDNGGGACDQKCHADQSTHFYCGGRSDDVYNIFKVGGREGIWNRNSPNNDAGGNQQCGTLIRKWPNDPYKLDDMECYESQPYICTAVTQRKCSSGNGRFETSDSGIAYCIVRGSFVKTWYEARDSCMDMGGDLATMADETEFGYLKTMFEQMTDSETTYWVGAVAHEWMWATGSYITYTNWADNYPRNLLDGPKCIMLDEYMNWKDVECDTMTAFACQFDDDECSTNPCGSHGTCVNKPGTYDCNCDLGYTVDGGTCSDTNECSATPNPCGDNAQCSNSIGSYTCSCDAGYVLIGSSCSSAVDECTTGVANCDTNAHCSDRDVGFTCTCNTGYTGDGVTCTATDIDECLESDTNSCDEHATCSNYAGGYSCTCNAGFTGNGITCTDINECGSPSANTCSASADCSNSPGSYTCTCKDGYEGDGSTCTETSNGGGDGGNTGTGTDPNSTNGEPAASNIIGDKTTKNMEGTTAGGGVDPGNAGASTNNESGGSPTKLGTAEIALIVLCVILLIVIIALIMFVCYYKRKNNLKNKVKGGDNTYDARNEAPRPYAGHLGDDYYSSNYYSGSDNGSTTGLVPAKNSRAAGQHQSNSNHYGNQKITLDDKY